MQNLFFVSVAIGIFSGTSLSAKAQPSVNMERMSAALPVIKSAKFIEGIENNSSKTVAVKPFIKKQASSKATVNDDDEGIENCSSLQFKYAQILNMDVEAITNYTLYNFIEEWWGTAYRYGGATKKGIDCSAFSSTLLHTVYGYVATRTARSQYDECEKIEKENLQEGDLVFFNTRRGVSHVGVYLRNGYFTHSSTGQGVTISSLDDAYYSKKFIGGGRVNLTQVEQ